MDRFLDVRTPESIAFSYELAGLGSRALAVMVDLVIQFALVALFFWGIVLIGAHYHPAKIAPAATPAQLRFAYNLVAGLFIFVLFAIFFGYFIFFEALWNGQTPGKKLLGIRVVRDGGFPIDFPASLIRNLVRVGEWTIGGYAIAAVSALLSPENKRIGDIAAGTIVVRDHRMEAPAQLLREIRDEPAYASTAYLSGEERRIVRRFLDRRDTLTPESRRNLAAQLANRVRSRVPADLQRLDDEALLERL
jgi:uncharacterized RDD family membrane protein YckC